MTTQPIKFLLWKLEDRTSNFRIHIKKKKKKLDVVICTGNLGIVGVEMGRWSWACCPTRLY